MRAITSSSADDSFLEDEDESPCASFVLAWERHLVTGLFAGNAVECAGFKPLTDLFASGVDDIPHNTETGLRIAGKIPENICNLSESIGRVEFTEDRKGLIICVIFNQRLPKIMATMMQSVHDRKLLLSYNSNCIGDRTKKGHLLKNFTFYRNINRDNLWNDPYHSSNRTWGAYHAVAIKDKVRGGDIDAIHRFEAVEASKRSFLVRSRSGTRARLNRRRECNKKRATSAILSPGQGLNLPRQDVCSGLTRVIGGDVGSLPKKALRNLITPLIEELDAGAIMRLQSRLNAEEELRNVKLAERQSLRSELLNDMRKREEYVAALERLSGISRPKSKIVTDSPYCANERLKSLAEPAPHKPLDSKTCLDGLELFHISKPEVFEALHNKSCES